MISYDISIDIPQAAKAVIDDAVLPLVNQALHAVGQQARANWMQAVHEAKLWSGEKDAYAASITMRMPDPMTVVIESDYKHAEAIETGRPPRDLKKMLDTSAKVRRTQDGGKRFLVIPFRHNTPGNSALAPSMPAYVYQQAKDISASSVVGQGMRRSGELTNVSPQHGMRALGERRQRRNPFMSDPSSKRSFMVNQNQYQWGDRIKPGMLQKEDRKRFAGMVRFDASAGGKKYSTYMTFRMMVEGSPGWIVPPQPGQYILKQVSTDIKPLAEQAVAEAVRRSLG